MEYLLTANVILVVGVAIKEFALPYFGSYVKWKARNLANIEDSGQLTRIVEGVRAEFAKPLESYKSELIHQRTKADWQRAEYKEKILIFQRLARLMVSSLTHLQLHHTITSGVYASLAMSRIANIDAAYKKLCLQTHNENLVKMEDHYLVWKDLIVDLKAVTYEVDIFFTNNSASQIREFALFLEQLIVPAVMSEQLSNAAKKLSHEISDRDVLREKLRDIYDAEWFHKIPSQRASEVINELRDHLRTQADSFH
ncbi:hypothetical protein ALQ24_00304 [Pseudomonas syringae pv. antirrhini]|uniref:hypothetical protein n=1 Tax=Pseudomonas TaxID=286 RepID=UPI00070B59E8|nr:MULTISPECIES: hypothetical protein [Pseudomonas]RMP40297.1 hypothetical protein ALQ24_00304 [Pseudomonas syringae pv. antirrhini]WIN05191.1 hypothetical protein QQF68_16410 [Pseudomonas syringae pv. antirrhini str. 126]